MQEQVNDGCFSAFVILLSLMYGFQYSGPDCSMAPYKIWVQIEVGYYSFNLLFCYLYYKHVKNNRRESFKMMLFNCFLNVLHTGWLVYGNIIWYQFNGQCRQEFDDWDKDQGGDGNSGESFAWIFLALVVVGYLPMLKCCSISTLIICFGPSLWRSLSRQQRTDANWVPTGANILTNMVKTRFKPEDHPEALECIICMEDYKPEDETIALPCDSRHFFHADCITGWLKTNNSCPLCKKPITMEDLKKQKKQRRSTRTSRGRNSHIE